jgi:hypothetical protein
MRARVLRGCGRRHDGERMSRIKIAGTRGEIAQLIGACAVALALPTGCVDFCDEWLEAFVMVEPAQRAKKKSREKGSSGR